MKKLCKTGSCCTTHRSEIFGAIFLAVATVLTLFTYSGAGIFGMFMVGLILCIRKQFGCKTCGCGANCECCCSMDMTTSEVPAKPVTPRKKTKKPA